MSQDVRRVEEGVAGNDKELSICSATSQAISVNPRHTVGAFQ